MSDIREIAEQVGIDCDSPILVYTTKEYKPTLKKAIETIIDGNHPSAVLWGTDIQIPMEHHTGDIKEVEVREV